MRSKAADTLIDFDRIFKDATQIEIKAMEPPGIIRSIYIIDIS